jgi:polysaccharide deacetylase 2 family uncharacterized protein YibQ
VILRRVLLFAVMAGCLAAVGLYLPKLYASVRGALGAWGASGETHSPSERGAEKHQPLADNPSDLPAEVLAQDPVEVAVDKPSAPEIPPSTDPIEWLTALPQDTLGDMWDGRLFRPLERAFHLPPKSVRRRGDKLGTAVAVEQAEVRFAKGLPLHEYAYAVEVACARNGINVIEASEIRLSEGRGSQARYLLRREGRTLQLTLKMGSEAMPGSARMALVILGLDSITLADAALLRDSPIPINLAFDPHHGNPALQALKSSGGEITLLAEIPMEPTAYPYINPGKNALYIHFDEAAVFAVLDRAFAQMTQARGIVTRHGDRAIENRLLLGRLYAYLAPRHLPLLDLTGSPRSLAREVAAERSGMAQRAQALRDTSTYSIELAKKVAQAVKSGEAVFAVHYSKPAFTHLLALIDERMPEFIEQGLAFVPLTHLNQMPRAGNEADSAGAVLKEGAKAGIQPDKKTEIKAEIKPNKKTEKKAGAKDGAKSVPKAAPGATPKRAAKS